MSRFSLDASSLIARGKQDVILEVDVLVKVLFEFPQSVVERVIRGASAFRRRELLTLIADNLEQHSGAIMFLGHHGDGVGDRSEATVRLLAAIGNGPLEPGNMREQNNFFFRQMLSQLFFKARERRLDDWKFGP